MPRFEVLSDTRKRLEYTKALASDLFKFDMSADSESDGLYADR
jgi:hypothetical protein